MKHEVVVAALIFFSFSVSSTVATFHGQLEKQGPQTSFKVGYASDQPSELDIMVDEKEGLNITYKESFSFQPSQISRSIVREGENIPVKEFSVNVESIEPVREEYEIPVTLTAYSDAADSGATSPRVVQQREYVFNYLTKSSEDYSFEGGLIDSGSSSEAEEPDNTNSTEEENSLTQQNQTVQESQKEEQKNSDNGTTTLLILAVVMVFTYTIYEAVT